MIKNKINLKQANYTEKCSLKNETTEILRSLGVPAHLKGYHYLRTAIIVSAKKPSLLNGIAKNLYPFIAGLYETTPTRVERAIRNAIEVAWNRGCDKIIVEFMRSSYVKPTNSELIAFAADELRLRFDMEDNTN